MFRAPALMPLFRYAIHDAFRRSATYATCRYAPDYRFSPYFAAAATTLILMLIACKARHAADADAIRLFITLPFPPHLRHTPLLLMLPYFNAIAITP